MNKQHRLGIDESISFHVTEFVAQSNGSIHSKGREELKAPPHKSLNSEEIIRPVTRISLIKRIYTDHHIRAHPCDPCSILNNLKGKISYQGLFYPVIEQGVAQ